jgi:hypothetical protein
VTDKDTWNAHDPSFPIKKIRTYVLYETILASTFLLSDRA